ncbi:hypothetical protein JXJ21_16365 [candidate division KSB1 bacterium]|nr:hypothetical protein [candidate division KSB1 bacterium]
MKRILIFHSNQQSIAELQSELAGFCDFYATFDFKTTREILKKKEFDCFVLHSPSISDTEMQRESLRLLKYLNRHPYQSLTKIVVCTNEDNQQVKDYLKLGVTAIVGDGKGVRLVLGE